MPQHLLHRHPARQRAASLPPQDLIYSVGPARLSHRPSRASLVQRLYDLLAPGGLLIIGNMNEMPLSNLWPMEFIADWTLQYRNEAEMLAWAEGLNRPGRGPRPSAPAACACSSSASAESYGLSYWHRVGVRDQRLAGSRT